MFSARVSIPFSRRIRSFSPFLKGRARGLAIDNQPRPYQITNKGIEVFPKQAFIRPNGYGSQVFLPWHYQARGSANEFHKLDKRDRLVPFRPEFLSCTPNQVISKRAEKARGGISFGNRPQPKAYASGNPWLTQPMTAAYS